MEKIVLLAGSHRQARDWFERKVVVISDKCDLYKLRGIEIESIRTTGTYRDRLDSECMDFIQVFANRWGIDTPTD